MVAKIKSGKSLIGALNYNENKVKKHRAKLIDAVGYCKDRQALSFQDKLFRLTDLAARNERAKTNTVHISLNFPHGETLTDERLRLIASDYMHGIGFDSQPYLVYRHEDAGHPHVHLVTTNIKRDGARISLHNLGRNASEQIRKAIEIKYGLTRAELQYMQKPDIKVQPEPAEYGKDETKRVITNILGYVLRHYKFTSLPELNAVLGLYAVQADGGPKNSRMYAHQGLVYWMLDPKGHKVGVPIKASTIYGKPTLKTLTEKFRLNEQLRKPFKPALISRIDQVLAVPQSPTTFISALYQLDIEAIIRRNEEGRIYGVTFVDRRNKVVFKGSDLGKAYSANALGAKWLPDASYRPASRSSQTDVEELTVTFHASADNEVLNALFEPEREDLAALNKYKKKRRKGLKL